MNYPTAEQRGINRNIHNRPKRRGINKPQAYETPVRRIYGGLVRLRRIEILNHDSFYILEITPIIQ